MEISKIKELGKQIKAKQRQLQDDVRAMEQETDARNQTVFERIEKDHGSEATNAMALTVRAYSMFTQSIVALRLADTSESAARLVGELSKVYFKTLRDHLALTLSLIAKPRSLTVPERQRIMRDTKDLMMEEGKTLDKLARQQAEIKRLVAQLPDTDELFDSLMRSISEGGSTDMLKDLGAVEIKGQAAEAIIGALQEVLTDAAERRQSERRKGDDDPAEPEIPPTDKTKLH